MHAFHLFSASALLSCLALAVPATLGPETKPWTLYQITLWAADSSTPGASYIDFLFQDSNKGRKTNTECYRAAIPGNKHTTINDPENYYTCADPGVAFKYNEGVISIARTYKDTTLDPQNNFVTSFGHATVPYTNKTEACGVLGTVDTLKVPISSTRV